MGKFFFLLAAFLLTELILAFAFSVISQVYYKKMVGIDFKAIFKGMFERIFLTVSLIHNIPHSLTLFSALKLATRLRHDEPKDEHNKFNDYYLLGNLASVTVAIFYSWGYANYDNIITVIATLFTAN